MKKEQEQLLSVEIPGLGAISPHSGMIPLQRCSDGHFVAGEEGISSIIATGDHKVEFIAFQNHTLAYVNSAMGHPAYYPVHPVRLERPVRYLLMDLDGTTVRSEHFWKRIIEMTVGTLLGVDTFSLEEADVPHVSGHSVSEHLQYCIRKYCPETDISEAWKHYFHYTRRCLQEILQGKRRGDFTPAPGVRDFLQEIKARGIKIALVTSGLYEKAWPEIVSAFKEMKLGAPEDFYDAIITAGTQPAPGHPGTLGELETKPHPWLYSEAATIGLQVKREEWSHVAGIDDSGAGICSIRLAGFAPLGIAGGNILQSGTLELCEHFAPDFESLYKYLTEG